MHKALTILSALLALCLLIIGLQWFMIAKELTWTQFWSYTSPLIGVISMLFITGNRHLDLKFENGNVGLIAEVFFGVVFSLIFYGLVSQYMPAAISVGVLFNVIQGIVGFLGAMVPYYFELPNNRGDMQEHDVLHNPDFVKQERKAMNTWQRFKTKYDEALRKAKEKQENTKQRKV